ncbi:MAG: 3'-5' exonuclease [Flavobacteriia bacterium]
MRLNLTKPLCFFDLETTGIQITKDRIVQIAVVKLSPDGTQQKCNYLVNPGISIPKEISEIHGITDEMVRECPTLDAYAEEIIAFFGDADLAGYNSNKFDIPFLVEEFYRVGTPFPMENRSFVDVQNIFHKMEQRTLAAAYQFYCGKTMENAHNALYDAEVTMEVFVSQMDKYPTLPNDVAPLSDFTRNSPLGMVDFAGRLARNAKNEVMYNFGKHKGKTVEEILKIEPGYYGWMLEADFPFQTKDCIRVEVARIKGNREKGKTQELQSKLDSLATKFNKK